MSVMPSSQVTFGSIWVAIKSQIIAYFPQVVNDSMDIYVTALISVPNTVYIVFRAAHARLNAARPNEDFEAFACLSRPYSYAAL